MPSISGQLSGGEYAVSLARLRLATKRVTSGTCSTPGSGTPVSVAVRSWVGVSSRPASSGSSRRRSRSWSCTWSIVPLPRSPRSKATVAPSTGPHSSATSTLISTDSPGRTSSPLPVSGKMRVIRARVLIASSTVLLAASVVAAAAVVGDPLRGAELGAEADRPAAATGPSGSRKRASTTWVRVAPSSCHSQVAIPSASVTIAAASADVPPGAATLPAPAPGRPRSRRSRPPPACRRWRRRPAAAGRAARGCPSSSGTGGMTSCPSPPT